jgi:hypothetical protein
MSKIKAPPASLDEHLKPEPSETPDYLAWKEAKIRRALAAADEHPERRVPAREIRKKFGLER